MVDVIIRLTSVFAIVFLYTNTIVYTNKIVYTNTSVYTNRGRGVSEGWLMS